MSLLDEVYSPIDRLVEKHGMWKMDTIGDAYVVVGGLDSKIEEHVLVRTAITIAEGMRAIVADVCQRSPLQRALVERCVQVADKSNHAISMRIGIHLGHVATGVVGMLRPRFHVYGAAVLEAEHLESTGQPGRIQVNHVFGRIVITPLTLCPQQISKQALEALQNIHVAVATRGPLQPVCEIGRVKRGELEAFWVEDSDGPTSAAEMQSACSVCDAETTEDQASADATA